MAHEHTLLKSAGSLIIFKLYKELRNNL